MNRTQLERARCMLSNADLPKQFWAEAINTACYLVNKSPSTAINCKTPEEMWSGSTANYSILRVFGCPAYAHVNEGKLEPRAKKCVFLGYQDGVKGYRLWDPQESKFMISRDVTFDETAILNSRSHEDHNNKVELHDVNKKVELDVETQKQPEKTHEEMTSIENEYCLARDRPRRQIIPPKRYEEFVAFALNMAESIDEQEPS